MERLNEEQIQAELENLSDWERIDEKWMQRKYRFKHYLAGITFVQTIANYAEEIQHHPFMSIDYKMVTVKLSSWQAKGLTDLDFDMADYFDKVYEEGEK